MASLFFNYGPMASSKTMNLLMVAHNYEAQGRQILVFTSGLDDRSGKNIIKSRVGPKRTALPVYEETNIYREVVEYIKEYGGLSCIICDEAQFYSEEHISQLASIVDDLDIPVMAYGLLTNFRGKLFDGSKALIELSDKIVEVKTLCVFCDKKATHNLRTNNKIPVYKGDTIQIGDDEYFPVCRKHHKAPKTNKFGEVLVHPPLDKEVEVYVK